MDAGTAAPKLVRLTGELLLLPWQAVASALTLLHKFRASSIAAELPDAVSACRADLTSQCITRQADMRPGACACMLSRDVWWLQLSS